MKALAALVLSMAMSCYGQSLATVQARCQRLADGATVAVGVQQDVILQALDACRDEAARLTPRKVSKIENLSNYLIPALAFAQTGYAAKRNMDWLNQRKTQKNAGQVEFNFATETFVAGYLGQRLVARAYRDWKHRRTAKQTVHDAITDAVLMPH